MLYEATINDEKIYFKYLLKNEIFENDNTIFKQKDINSVYTYIQDYYKSYNSIPTGEILVDKLEVKKAIIQTLYDLDELDKYDSKWIENKLDLHIKTTLANLELSNLIDKSRNGGMDYVLDKLGINTIFEKEIDPVYEELPTISQEIYDNLPEMLKEITQLFEGQKKDVILTSALSTISMFFSNIKSYYYEGSISYNNIYTFIIAKSSTGKSIMNKCKLLTYDFNLRFRESYKYLKEQYNQMTKEDKLLNNQPIEKVFVGGGDATKQGLYKYMMNNDGVFLLFDTEADALTDKNDDVNGDYSIIIRKSIQNESITKLLATQDSTYIDNPRLNICISGTQDQVKKLIGKNGAENGTFNRFIYYDWDVEPTIEDPHKNKDANDVFMKYSKKLDHWYNEYFKICDKYTFELSENQNKLFFESMKKIHDDVLRKSVDGSSAIIKRHYLFAQKIMITFAALRAVEKIDNSEKDFFNNVNYIPEILNISDSDFLNVLKLIDVYISHSLKMINYYTPVQNEVKEKISWKIQVWNSLKKSFTRKQAIEIGNKINISDTTIDRWIKTLKSDDIIEKNGYNYNKLKEL